MQNRSESIEKYITDKTIESKILSFCDGWSFIKTGIGTSLDDIEKIKEDFVPVEIPHDWLIYDTNNLYEDSFGWYLKNFDVKLDKKMKYILRFDGVYMDSTVYINRSSVFEWKNGYSTFDVDITDALQDGLNEIIVLVRFQSPCSRWYSGAGIYRKVWLKICTDTYLPIDGTYIHTEESDGGYDIEIETEVVQRQNDNITVRYSLYKDDEQISELGNVNPVYEGSCIEESNKKSDVAIAVLKAFIKNPKRWSIDEPNCYKLVVELWDNNEGYVLDRQDITVGFRTLTYDTQTGLYLNGEHVKIHGACDHHDLGALGAAFNKAAMKRKLIILKQMGCNAIRTSHNMPAKEVMDLADEMGFMVMSEAFDMWERCKNPYDYGRFFIDWHERDVRSWVRRDRNHPSLILWSIGNEIYDTHVDGHGKEITIELKRCVKFHDRKGNARITIASNYMPWENARKCADVLKVAGYNYGEKCYSEQHKEHPDWIMYGSETASFAESRGIYRFPLEQNVLTDEDEQCSSLGNSFTSWGAKSWDKCITDDRDAPYILGQFLWSGFDYIGEPTPYHTKNSYMGQIDTAGFPKDSYYVFQAQWTDAKEHPMVHLFPYWDFNIGQLIDVRACTNGAFVELFLNGKSMGKKEIDHEHGMELLATWKVAYEPGYIEAVAYDEAGNIIAREKKESFGDSRKIILSADKNIMKADGEDICFITVQTIDENGRYVENASDYVEVFVEGPGRIMGMDNGDSTDYDQYKSSVRKLFSGKLLILVGSTFGAGNIKLTVRGRNLQEATFSITSESTLDTDIHYLEDLSHNKDNSTDRVPIRKLEIVSQNGQCIDNDNREIEVYARLFPSDTTDRELIWKVVNSAGIEVGFASIESVTGEDGEYKAVVKAIGDGEFYIRCMARNKDKVVLISQLECRAIGLGQAYINPYSLVSAGLYKGTIGEIGNGNEKGIATSRDEASGVWFEKIDFGEFGSDLLTLPIFALSDDKYIIDIWEGIPYEDASSIITTVEYKKPSIWNVYQEETYKLPRRLKGIVTIGFIMHAKVHLKGFVFKKINKAFEKLTGEDADLIYGDSFTRDNKSIKNIGNNVSIIYDNMDFMDEGCQNVTICGNTPLLVNTIHIHFTNEYGEVLNQIIEFKGNGTQNMEEQSFVIEKLMGKGKIELIFLPGSKFNFEYIKF